MAHSCAPATLAVAAALLCGIDCAGAQQAPPVARSYSLPVVVMPAPAPSPTTSAAPPAVAAPAQPAAGAPAAGPTAGQIKPAASWPVTLTESRAQPQPPKLDHWSDADIAAAKARCNLALKGLDAVVIPQVAFKKGACGAPAAVQLVSLGKSPQVAFDPPPVLTCEMVAALAKWLRDDLQPSAKRHLGAPLVRIDVMSDYSCRAAYGRARGALSEHARANALDIRGFVTTAAATADLLAHWGPTAREVRAQVAAAKAAADRANAQRAIAAAQPPAAGPQAPLPQQPPSQMTLAPAAGPAGPATSVVNALRPAIGTIADGVPGLRLPGPRTGEANAGYGLAVPDKRFTQPNWLGGPKPAAGAVVDGARTGLNRAQFLRDAQQSACRTFGTVLGPEADVYHRNHFHVDMAERRTGSFCQ